jgi:hypothetical protein
MPRFELVQAKDARNEQQAASKEPGTEEDAHRQTIGVKLLWIT